MSQWMAESRLAAGFRVAGAQRHVEAAADLLVEQDLAGEFLDALVGADGKFAHVARTVVGIQRLAAGSPRSSRRWL